MKRSLLLAKLEVTIPEALHTSPSTDSIIAATYSNFFFTFTKWGKGAIFGDILGSQVQDLSEELIKSKFGELVTSFPLKGSKPKPLSNCLRKQPLFGGNAIEFESR